MTKRELDELYINVDPGISMLPSDQPIELKVTENQRRIDTSEALLTNVNGDTTKIQWGQDGEVSALSQCSLTFENRFYILG